MPLNLSRRRSLLALTALATVAVTIAAYIFVTAGEAPEVSGRVAYVVDGNLFIKELPDGEPRQITNENNVHRPEWSPTGESLAYSTEDPVRAVGDTKAWITNAATGETREAGFPPVWAPNRDYLIEPGEEFGVMTVTTADGQLIRRIERGLRPYRVEWTADGEAVIYIHFERLADFEDGVGIRVLNLNSGTDELLFTVFDRPSFLRWSSDGQYLFFGDGDAFKFLSVESGEVDEVEFPLVLDSGDQIQRPGGSSILAVETTLDALWGGKRIGLLEPEDGSFAYLTNPEVAAIHPRWSPDGQQIAYEANPDRSDAPSPTAPDEVEALLEDRHIWIMDADGSNQRQVTADPRYRDEDPEWTADGEHLLFARVDLEFPDNDPSLWLLNVSTGNLTQLVEAMSYSPQRESLLPEGTSFLGTVDWLYDFHP